MYLDKNRFDTILRCCKAVIESYLDANLPIGFDFDSKLYADGIRQDISLIQCLCGKGSRILDFGCGRGTITSILSMLGFQVVGLDIKVSEKEYLVERLSMVLPPKCQSKIWRNFQRLFNTHFIFYGDKNIPFRDESFNAVLAYAVIEHISSEVLGLLLAEIKRILKPKGFLFISRTPRTQSITEKISAHALRLRSHERLLNEQEIISLLRDYNFYTVRIERTDMLPSFPPIIPLKLWNSLFKLTSSMNSLLLKTPLSHFSHHIRIIAQKGFSQSTYRDEETKLCWR